MKNLCYTNEPGNDSDGSTFENNLKGDRVFIGGNGGRLFEHSVKKNRMFRKLCPIFDSCITSMTISHDKKSLYVCSFNGGFKQFTIRSNKVTIHFGIEKAY